MKRKHNCPCALPSATEEELITLPGASPDTALRVRVEPNLHGYVRLEQLAYSDDLGWYTQKSFCIPGELLAAVATQLRKADCLIPKPQVHDEWEDTIVFPGRIASTPAPEPTPGSGPTLLKREA
jgi:hypothetical protein